MARTHDETQAREQRERDSNERRSTLAPATQQRLKDKAERESKAFQARDEALYRRATEGVPDQETLDAVLALGGDATRASPVREQVLPDADPGLTTTTGAYRSPLDPTTAAVPAAEDSDVARNVGGTPTVGSDGHGEPEERWWPGDVEGGPIERLRNLPTQDERNDKEAARAAELAPKPGQRADRPVDEGRRIERV